MFLWNKNKIVDILLKASKQATTVHPDDEHEDNAQELHINNSPNCDQSTDGRESVASGISDITYTDGGDKDIPVDKVYDKLTGDQFDTNYVNGGRIITQTSACEF